MIEMKRARYDSSICNFNRREARSRRLFFLPFLQSDMRLLDVGRGPGNITATMARHVRSVVGVDIQARSIAAANQLVEETGIGNLSFIEADMTTLPFNEEEFDAVFFHAVLYHQDKRRH